MKSPRSKYEIPKRLEGVQVGHWTIDLLQTRNGNLGFTVYERGKDSKNCTMSIDGVITQSDHVVRGNTVFSGLRRLECTAPRVENHLEKMK